MIISFTSSRSTGCVSSSTASGEAPISLPYTELGFRSCVSRLSHSHESLMTPAQDPNQPEGKILRLTLEAKPALGNPNYGKEGARTIPLIDPPSDREAAKTARVASNYTFHGPNVTPADGHGGARVADRWNFGKRLRNIEEGPDGSLWILEDSSPGALIYATTLVSVSR